MGLASIEVPERNEFYLIPLLVSRYYELRGRRAVVRKNPNRRNKEKLLLSARKLAMCTVSLSKATNTTIKDHIEVLDGSIDDDLNLVFNKDYRHINRLVHRAVYLIRESLLDADVQYTKFVDWVKGA